MNTVLALMDSTSPAELISFQGVTETKRTFSARVQRLYETISAMPTLKTGDFILIAEENPIRLYSLVFALWKNGNKIIVPTKDVLAHRPGISYYHYEIICPGGVPCLRENKHFHPLRLDHGGDTIIYSSGSTGAPKGILHNKESFLANALSVAEVVSHRNITSVTYLKPHVISAISHFLVHWLTDSHLIFVEYDEAARIRDLYRRRTNIALVGSPMHLISGLNFLPHDADPCFFFSSGDFIAGAAIAEALRRFPKARFYHVYGLAELAGRFFINVIDAATDPARHESVGKNIKGTAFTIIDGELFVKSPFNFLGYVRSSGFEASCDFHPTGDRAFSDFRGLFLAGRSNEEIKVLGNKVSLTHIERKIKAVLPQDAVVLVAEPHPSLGTLLSLVIKGPGKTTRTDLTRRLRGCLHPHELPHKYYAIDDIPLTPSAKIDRRKIAAQLSSLTQIGA